MSLSGGGSVGVAWDIEKALILNLVLDMVCGFSSGSFE